MVSDEFINANETDTDEEYKETNLVARPKIKTIYELLGSYPRDQVDVMLTNLSKKDKALIVTRYGDDLNNPIFTKSDEKYDQCKVGGCDVVKENGKYYMFYIGYQNVDTARICIAESMDGVSNWIRSKDNPIISPERKSWDADAVYKPTIIFNKQENKIMMWFNGRKKECERIGYAEYNLQQ